MPKPRKILLQFHPVRIDIPVVGVVESERAACIEVDKCCRPPRVVFGYRTHFRACCRMADQHGTGQTEGIKDRDDIVSGLSCRIPTWG
jgi:hypothetical protein